MAGKTYIAQRQLQVGEGFIHPGERYPAASLTPSLTSLAWVVEGVGPMPKDKRCHQHFSPAERGAKDTTPKAKKGSKPPASPPVGIGEAFPDLPVDGTPEPEEAVVGGRKKKVAAPAKPAAKKTRKR